MKKLFLIIMIGGFFSSCNKTTKYKTTNDGRNIEVLNANSFNSPGIKYIEFDGHEYVYLLDYTVAELIEELKRFDENLKVRVQFRDDGGDYCGTDEEVRLIQVGDILIL